MNATSPNILTAKETASVLRVSEDTVYTLVKGGSLPHLRIGRRVVFPQDALMEWINANTYHSKGAVSGRDDLGGRRAGDGGGMPTAEDSSTPEVLDETSRGRLGTGADTQDRARGHRQDGAPRTLRSLPPLAGDRRAPDTIKGYRTGTGRLVAYCTSSGIVYADELNRGAVGEYLDHLRSSVSQRTAAQYTIVASVCFAWAVDRGYLSHNPFAGLARRSRKTTRRILTDEERRTIVAEADRSDLWAFMLGTGTRVIEVCRIETEHVRLLSPVPHVMVRGKGDKERTIPLGKETAAAAKRLLAAGGGKLWPWRRRALHDAWVADRKALNLPKNITPHVFRHDFASWLVNVELLPLPDVQRVLGHADLATTAIYLHPDGRRLGEAMNGRSRSLEWQQAGNNRREAL